MGISGPLRAATMNIPIPANISLSRLVCCRPEKTSRWSPLRASETHKSPRTESGDQGTNASGETMTVKLRWKAPDADVSQLMEVPVKDSGAKLAEASPETRWALAVAGFAALLNNSQFNGLTWDEVRAMARGSKGADPNGYRGEFLQLLDRAESVRR